MAAGHDPDRFTPPPDQGLDEQVEMPPLSEHEIAEHQLSDVERVLRHHQAQLLSIAGVEGFGIGRTPAGADAIVVYLRDAGAGAGVPKQLDGFAVVPVVTGRVEPL